VKHVTTRDTTYIALLRGINVGTHDYITMADLKRVFVGLGFRNVKTYVNSGNVIFVAGETDPRKIETLVEDALAKRVAQPVTVVARSLAEMDQIMRHVPNHWQTATDEKCNVIFLRYTIDSPDILANLDPKPEIEELHYHPGVLFWSAKTSSLTKSGMLKVNTMPIYKDMTVRVLHTTQKIYEIMQQTAATEASAP
jgi:uncharacterized protein (DUF1697 family)